MLIWSFIVSRYCQFSSISSFCISFHWSDLLFVCVRRATNTYTCKSWNEFFNHLLNCIHYVLFQSNFPSFHSYFILLYYIEWTMAVLLTRFNEPNIYRRQKKQKNYPNMSVKVASRIQLLSFLKVGDLT